MFQRIVLLRLIFLIPCHAVLNIPTVKLKRQIGQCRYKCDAEIHRFDSSLNWSARSAYCGWCTVLQSFFKTESAGDKWSVDELLPVLSSFPALSNSGYTVPYCTKSGKNPSAHEAEGWYCLPCLISLKLDKISLLRCAFRFDNCSFSGPCFSKKQGFIVLLHFVHRIKQLNHFQIGRGRVSFTYNLKLRFSLFSSDLMSKNTDSVDLLGIVIQYYSKIWKSAIYWRVYILYTP